ncbi:MAG TPA: GIY-YIG nuclease family protein [Candidatus Dormibacteraeota bacterium]|nr:GIY-YIG nuclease family protein [Candidatus Dormibacteraeota bacterium]
MADGASRAFVYLLRCRDGSLYAGWTTDLAQRLRAHAEGRGARYTRSRLPVALAASWEVPGRQEALRLEARIKRMKRREKLALCPSGD